MSDSGGVIASGNSLLVGESIASWSADFHPSHLSQILRPPLFVGVFLQGAYKPNVGGQDTVEDAGGKLDRSRDRTDQALMRLRGSAKWELRTPEQTSGLGLGFRTADDVWYDLRHSVTCSRVTGTARLYVAKDRFFDFVFDRGSDAPNFNKGDQFSADLP